jgi:hypothetical protein
MDTVTLYWPAGPEGNWSLCGSQASASGLPAYPREQPIFYPVTNERYAVEIASRWNLKDSGVGYVTRFQVSASFTSRYEGLGLQPPPRTANRQPFNEAFHFSVLK